jgi:hypothetical protein
VRASIAYKGSWVRRTRSFATDEAGRTAFARAERWLDQAVRALAAERPLAAQLDTSLAGVSGATLVNWLVESTVGSYPLEQVAGSGMGTQGAFPPRAFLVLSVNLVIDDIPWLGGAPAFVSPAA